MPVASAEKFDVEQEIKISSSRQAADLKNKIFSYIDNVIITQGTLKIHADLVQVITQEKAITKFILLRALQRHLSKFSKMVAQSIYKRMKFVMNLLRIPSLFQVMHYFAKKVVKLAAVKSPIILIPNMSMLKA